MTISGNPPRRPVAADPAPQPTSAAAAAATSKPSGRRRPRWAWGVLAITLAAVGGGVATWSFNRDDPGDLWHRAKDELNDHHPAEVEVLLNRLARFLPPRPEQRYVRAQAVGVQGRDSEAADLFRGVPERDIREGAELRLIPGLDNPREIPTQGKDTVIVAEVRQRLYFRIFDIDGQMLADSDETRLTGPASEIETLRGLLKGHWPPAPLAKADRDRIVAAVTSVGRFVQLAPTARLRAGQIERDRHRIHAAELDYLEALRIDPTLVQARRELIYIYGMQLRRKEVREQFYRLAELIPPTFHDAMLLGLTRNVMWEPGEAAGILAQYVRADPTDQTSRLALARQLQVLNRYEEVEAALTPLPPTDPAVLEIRAQSALARGDLPAARDIAARAPADSPELAPVRAQLAAARRDWATAAGFFRAMISADPHSRVALRGLGQALSALGDPVAARRYLEAARIHDRLGNLVEQTGISGAGNDYGLIHRLGDACLEAGLQAEARIWYRLAIQHDPLDTQAQQGLFAAAQPPPAP